MDCLNKIIDDLKKKCDCGKEHKISLEYIYVMEDASKELTVLKNYRNIVVIYDTNTYKAINGRINQYINTKSIILNANNLHADEKVVATVLKELDNDCDLLIAGGAGTIHDITRYVAFDRNIDFVSYPTAPSVDGFVSSVAAMTWYGLKKTFTSSAPIGIFADINIIENAPYQLIASGFSDMIGKYIALADWKICSIAMDEYLCEKIYNTMALALENIVENIDNIYKKEEKAIISLTESLILSGIAMQMIGNSRPASGAEHHLSHFWEMALINPPTTALHGEKVGVATIHLANYYHNYFKNNEYISEYNGIDVDIIRKHYKSLANDVISDNKDDLLANIPYDSIKKCSRDVKKIIDNIPMVDTLLDYYKRVGAKYSMSLIDLNDDILDSSLKLAPYVRVRPTFLRMTNL